MSDPCREAFEKAGYWPNEVMWKAWQQAWAAALATSSAGTAITDPGAVIAARVKALEAIESIVLDYVKDYEWRGDEACHYPDANERALIADAIAGLHADNDFVSAWDAWRALCRATPSATAATSEPPRYVGGFCQDREKCLVSNKNAKRYRWLNKADNFMVEIDDKPVLLKCGDVLDTWLDSRIEEDATKAMPDSKATDG